MSTRWMAVMAFVLTFAAGVGVGLLIPWPHAKQAERNDGPMAELNLTPVQREQMKTIWAEETGDAMQASSALRREAFGERRQAVEALLTEEQRAEYARIQEAFEQQMRSSHEARRAAFTRANERTRAMLTDEQREEFDAWLEQRRKHFERGRDRDDDAEGERGHWRGWRDGREGREDRPQRSDGMDRRPGRDGPREAGDRPPRPSPPDPAAE